MVTGQYEMSLAHRLMESIFDALGVHLAVTESVHHLWFVLLLLPLETVHTARTSMDTAEAAVFVTSCCEIR